MNSLLDPAETEERAVTDRINDFSLRAADRFPQHVEMLLLESMAGFVPEPCEIGCALNDIAEHQGGVPFKTTSQDPGELILEADNVGKT